MTQFLLKNILRCLKKIDYVKTNKVKIDSRKLFSKSEKSIFYDIRVIALINLTTEIGYKRRLNKPQQPHMHATKEQLSRQSRVSFTNSLSLNFCK